MGHGYNCDGTSVDAVQHLYCRYQMGLLFFFSHRRFSVDVRAGSASQNGHDPMDVDSSSPGLLDDVANAQQQPWFVIKPIDSHGQSIGKERLEDRGNKTKAKKNPPSLRGFGS